jgi:hypothetical protein
MPVSTSDITFPDAPFTSQNAQSVSPANFIWRVSRLSFPFLARLSILTDLSDRPASPFNLSTHLKGPLHFHGRAPVAHILPANPFSPLTPTACNGPSLTVAFIPLPQLPIAYSYQVFSCLTRRGT